LPYKIIANLNWDTMSASVTFSVNLPFVMKKEGDVYVSWCPLLDVSAFGKTRDEARVMLAEAVKLFIMNCFERGTLDKVLRDSGFIKILESKKKQTQAAGKDFITVPLPRDLNLRLAQCLT